MPRNGQSQAHLLLRRAWAARCDSAPKRLLFLRVFNAADKRERLFDALDDTWRRIGRIDLIGGTDLAMRTLRSLTLECFLLKHVDTEFFKTDTEVEHRLARLRSRLEGDLRYPVNEVYCYADAWQAAVLRLAPASDVVLLDLRGFTQGNAGCSFEITNVVWHVPLTRVVLLADRTTDAKALEDVARAAWAALPSASPNASAAAPRLMVVSISGPAEIETVVRVLFRTAFREGGQ